MTTPALPTLDDLAAAARLIAPHVPPTPQYRWPLIEARVRGPRAVWLKHENHTPAGAFKVRGGLVYLDALKRERPDVEGVVSATRGNHGQSIGFAARRTGHRVVIVVPHGNSREKNAAMRALGAELIEDGHDFAESCDVADRVAAERGYHRLPSFDLRLVAGVGTYAVELLRAVPDLERLYVPIGLGSGICGCYAAKEALGHPVEIVAVVSAHATAMAQSLHEGRAVESVSTTRIADGMATRRPDATAFAVLMARRPHVVAVTDDEVEQAMRALFHDTHNVAEGAGAAALAAVIADGEHAAGRSVAAIVCGGNVDSDVFARVLTGTA
ncbi:MAG: threonine dehydratase [Gemmatimonadaceae bacterium]|jgi:threonine dehydratase|nr:threonine dehydratase [Gemmatimonadaceae bacterium]